MSYYTNSNPDLLARITLSARQVLEIGCGAGNFGRTFLARNPSARYIGIELFEDAARQAAGFLSHVILGDIERPTTFAELDRVRAGEPFDAVILGDVLEHLHNPEAILAESRSRLVPGGLCVACIPNVAHWSVLQQQLKGRWDYAGEGLLDRTHIRFFTLETAIEMLQKAGWTVLDAKPRVLWPEKTDAALEVFEPLAEPLGVAPEKLRRDLSAYQWVIRAVNGPAPASLTVAALGLKKVAGVNEPRVDHPMAALATLPFTRVAWGAGGVSVPPNSPPGVFVLHRQFMNDPSFNAQVDHMIAQGWVIVADMDDDPHNWKEFIETDFRAYRGVHAVTVSTEPLAKMIRQWNPNVEVFPNAILDLPQVVASTPKQGQRIRVFFGALNRGPDWAGLSSELVLAARALVEKMEFVVVHDKAFFDALPEELAKEFHPTAPHGRYMDLLASCDVALLPLNDTAFNRLKSDLKFIECCAAGVVPICSPVVYADVPRHRDIGVFPESAKEWGQALLRLCTDSHEIQRRRRLGLDYVKSGRMHCHQAGAREAYYRRLLLQREILEVQRQQRLQALP